MFDDDFDDLEFFLLLLIVTAFYTRRYRSTSTKLVQNPDPFAGDRRIRTIIRLEHPSRAQNTLRMPLDTFIGLHDWLIRNTELQSSRGMSSLEKLAIFLNICGAGLSFRTAMEIWEHSTETLHR